MTKNWLNHDIPSERLQEIYRQENYYWYLKSQEFRQKFLRTLGSWIDQYGKPGPCLDVGCGEGWLSEYVTIPYIGFDGASTAVQTAIERYTQHRDRLFLIGRIEAPEKLCLWGASIIVFGGILSVLVKPVCRLDFIQHYVDLFKPKAFIVYDLEKLDTEKVRTNFSVLEELHETAEVLGLQEVKKHRQIVVFEVNDG